MKAITLSNATIASALEPTGGGWYDPRTGIWYDGGYLAAGGKIHDTAPSMFVPNYTRHAFFSGEPADWIAAVRREWTELRHAMSGQRHELAALRRELEERYDDLRCRDS